MNPLAIKVRLLYEQRRFAECEGICRTMLDDNPNDVDALSTLGYLAMHGGAPELAVKFFSRAVRLEPGDPGHRGVLATALRAAGQHADALKAQQACVGMAPRDAAALTNLAQQYAEAGRFEDAIDAYEQAIAINHSLGKAHYGLALIKKFAPDDARIAIMMREFEGGSLVESDRIGISFALGRAFDDLGDFDRAFEFYRQGNELRGKKSRYDPVVEQQYVQRISSTFTKSILEQFHGAGDGSTVPIFVIGMPRSGSTLVEQILAAHPAIKGGGELPWAAQVIATVLAHHVGPDQQLPEATSKIPAKAWADMGAAYLSKIATLQKGASHVVDKQLFNYKLIGPIHLMLPEARFIHCLRDPLDTCTSCFTQNFGADLGFSCNLEHLGMAFRNYQQIIAHWRAWLPAGAMYEIRYEELVENTEKTTRSLVDFLGLPWSETCLESNSDTNAVITSSLAQVRKPITTNSVGRWRRYEKHLAVLRGILQTDKSNE